VPAVSRAASYLRSRNSYLRSYLQHTWISPLYTKIWIRASTNPDPKRSSNSRRTTLRHKANIITNRDQRISEKTPRQTKHQSRQINKRVKIRRANNSPANGARKRARLVKTMKTLRIMIIMIIMKIPKILPLMFQKTRSKVSVNSRSL